MSCGMAHEMERGELEAEVDALFERSDARIHAVMHAICRLIIENDSSSYNANRGIENEEATTYHDPDSKSR